MSPRSGRRWRPSSSTAEQEDAAAVGPDDHLWSGARQRRLERPLTRTDITTPTPFNTYTIPALPPGPIGNPGRASLEAPPVPPSATISISSPTVPADTPFAPTLDQHNKNVARWRQIERERKVDRRRSRPARRVRQAPLRRLSREEPLPAWAGSARRYGPPAVWGTGQGGRYDAGQHDGVRTRAGHQRCLELGLGAQIRQWQGLDVRLRLPGGWEGLENGLRQSAARVLARGNVNANLSLTRTDPEVSVRVNEAVLRSIAQSVRRVAEDLGAPLFNWKASSV